MEEEKCVKSNDPSDVRQSWWFCSTFATKKASLIRIRSVLPSLFYDNNGGVSGPIDAPSAPAPLLSAFEATQTQLFTSWSFNV